LTALPKGFGDVCSSPPGVTHFLLMLVNRPEPRRKGDAVDDEFSGKREGGRSLTASHGPRSSKTLSTSKNVAAARNFLAVFRVAAPRLSSLSAELNTLKAKSSTYAEDTLSTVMASDGPTVERRFSRVVRRATRKLRFGVLTALRAIPTWAA
jgi:hypothetical protein